MEESRAGEVDAPLLGACGEMSLNEAANGAGLGSSYSDRSASVRNEQERASIALFLSRIADISNSGTANTWEYDTQWVQSKLGRFWDVPQDW